MSYTKVHISNSTPYSVKGTVEYAVCSNDDYTAGASGGEWTAGGRGVCLVTKITATIEIPGGDVDAIAYTSAGTTYWNFAVIKTGASTYYVTRVTNPPDSIDVGELQTETAGQ